MEHWDLNDKINPFIAPLLSNQTPVELYSGARTTPVQVLVNQTTDVTATVLTYNVMSATSLTLVYN